jgi:effector-binding domain-containing protein
MDPDGPDTLAGGKYLMGYTRGYYGQTNGIQLKFKEYAEKNNCKFEGPVYNIYLLNELSVPDHDKYLLQVSCKLVE